MSAEKFIQRAEIYYLLQELKAECGNRVYSDIVDEAGHQYVDLVMEGGGVLGVALVGYTYVLEEMGVRFLGIGGTSAGSINALLLAALGTPEERKSEKIVQYLADLNLYDFIDGDSDVKNFVRFLVQQENENENENETEAKGFWRKFLQRAEVGVNVVPILDNAFRDLGLNPGLAFQNYISGIIKEAGIAATGELKQHLSTLPQGLRMREGDPIPAEGFSAQLGIVAADVSTETKVVFPKMAGLYWAEPDRIDPALYVRASMSIPYFFQPFMIKDIPNDAAAWNNWQTLASYTEGPPQTAVFVDGGIMSNFPIDLFHKYNTVPRAPTFGVKLGSDHRTHRKINTLEEITAAIFNSARHCMDYDFIARNPDYRRLVTYVDTTGHNWLNFEMEQAEKIELFTKGAQAAANFLRQFDWPAYKRLRKQLLYRPPKTKKTKTQA